MHAPVDGRVEGLALAVEQAGVGVGGDGDVCAVGCVAVQWVDGARRQEHQPHPSDRERHELVEVPEVGVLEVGVELCERGFPEEHVA
ncbi:MAG: hypothetical protein WBA97_10420 [Actinophytocola sp.]